MNIVQRIEALRKELIEQGMKRGFQDSQVLRTSKMLDDLINEYFKITEGKSQEKAAS